MNTDRELLELAAKAAGIDGWLDPNEALFIRAKDDADGCAIWNPLTDDGDALRLAVKLTIAVLCGDGVTTAQYASDLLSLEDHATDPDAATRRAIVRTAAELGKSL